MNIYTSYFAKYKELPEDLTAVSICRFTPWWVGDMSSYTKLAPTTNLLLGYKHGRVTKEEYIEEYKRETLYRVPVPKILEELTALLQEGHTGIVLFCYEKPHDFCHRHIVAEHITKYSDLTVGELVY